MIRPLSQSYVPHVTHNDILCHVRRTVENDVLVTPSEIFQRHFQREIDGVDRRGRGVEEARRCHWIFHRVLEWHKSRSVRRKAPRALCVSARLCRVWSMHRGVSMHISFVIIGYCMAICNNAVVFGNYHYARPIPNHRDGNYSLLLITRV